MANETRTAPLRTSRPVYQVLESRSCVYRRALLAALPTALAGCSLAPRGPTTERYPATPPNIFAEFAWNAERSSFTVTFTQGNRLTPENTGILVVVSETEAGLAETVWVATDEALAADDLPPDAAVADFPLEPGATLTHSVPEQARTRLVWVAPDENRSMAVANWIPDTETQTEATGSTEGSGQ